MATLKGGQKLQEAMAKLAAKVNKPAKLKVGFLTNARYPDGTPVAMIAAIQDFGAPGVGIPPRPFFRNMIADKQSGWAKAIGDLLTANDYDVEKTLNLAGAGIEGQLRQSIIDTNTPPLAESTIRRKGHSKPLVDTGHMLNSIDHEVVT